MSKITHPLQPTPTRNSGDSLPTPPRSPTLGTSLPHGAPAPLDHAPLSLEGGTPLSPAMGASTGGYFGPALTPSSSADPLLLKSKVQTEEHISELRKRKGNKSAAYYKKQNETIDDLLKSLDQHVQEAEEEEDANRLSIKIAIYGSLICNCVLATLQLYAAIASQSLSIFATASDSVFDPAANFLLNWCHRRAQRVDLRKYPSGGSRFESIGDIVYSNIMTCVSVILIAFSIQDLARRNTDKELHIPSLVVVGIAFAVKFALFLYCYSIRGKNSQVRVLWEDHRNDLYVNGFGICTAAAGAKIQWWIDPTGAMIISCFLIFSWVRTASGHFQDLAGKAAPKEFINLVTYKAMTFAEQIDKIDSVLVYHSGPQYIVEVDLVMDSDTTLRVAHDVSQALQDKLEELPQVGRAFVHVDHETSHAPEHRKKK
ncbi:hypothetical protein JCM10207_005487 [Rhodosporidiobolus poonsookiae]